MEAPPDKAGLTRLPIGVLAHTSESHRADHRKAQHGPEHKREGPTRWGFPGRRRAPRPWSRWPACNRKGRRSSRPPRAGSSDSSPVVRAAGCSSTPFCDPRTPRPLRPSAQHVIRGREDVDHQRNVHPSNHGFGGPPHSSPPNPTRAMLSERDATRSRGGRVNLSFAYRLARARRSLVGGTAGRGARETVPSRRTFLYSHILRLRATSSARTIAPALFLVSSYSRSGTESATTPPPAWK